MTSTTETAWHLQGDYFENCSCDVQCPCEVAPEGPLQAPPSQGHCDAIVAVHVDEGSYGGVRLDGLNALITLYAQGPMGNGGWKLAMYLDNRADDAQREARDRVGCGLTAIGRSGLAALTRARKGDRQAPSVGQSGGLLPKSMEVVGVARELGDDAMRGVPNGREEQG